MHWKTSRSILLVAVVWGLNLAAFSQTLKTCSNADLKGDYGFSFHGTNLGLKVGMVMVGKFNADGQGNLKGTESQSVNGKVARGPFTGTYVVNPDCTGSAEITFMPPNAERVDFVIVGDGDEILMMDVGGNTLESGEAKRQFRKAKKT
jgi:hypothetical protein